MSTSTSTSAVISEDAISAYAMQSDMLEKLEQEQKAMPAIGDLVGVVETLLPEYTTTQSTTQSDSESKFVEGIRDVERQGFKRMRRIRKDGNCFYRGFLFGLLAHFATTADGDGDNGDKELKRLIDLVEASEARLEKVGVQSFVSHEPRTTMLEALIALRKKPKTSLDDLLSMFREDGDLYLVWFMRLMTSCQLKLHSEQYLPFIEDAIGLTMDQWCAREVEPMGKESEQIQIMALCHELSVPVRLMYLDGRAETVDAIVLPDPGADPVVTLLYRPGHYDFLESEPSPGSAT